MQLSKYFTLEEFIASDTAARLGIDNTPNAGVLGELRETALRMDWIRDLLGVPVYITSAFRCAALNSAVGGGPKSHHIGGYAVDFKAPAFGSPLEVARLIDGARFTGRVGGFDQLIHEFGRWVHVSFHPDMRGQTLTIDRVADRVRTRAGLHPIKGV